MTAPDTSLSILDGRIMLFVGDCIEQLALMEADSVDCVVTSPPYWMLRNYDVDGQIGMEPTLVEHMEMMVQVFRAIRRVLKPTGTVWLNYGDAYASAPNGRSAEDTKQAGDDDRTFRDKPGSTIGGTAKNKDLLMMPNRLAIALQDDGWWVRAECIWGKNNPMPDSNGAQRPGSAHEKVFLLTKTDSGDVWRARDTGDVSFFPDLSQRCPLVTDASRMANRWSRIGSYYDANTVKQALTGNTHERGTKRTPPIEADGVGHEGWTQPMTRDDEIQGRKKPSGWDVGPGAHGKFHRDGRETKQAENQQRKRGTTPRHDGHIQHEHLDSLGRGQGRYLRNYEPAPLTVWTIATKPFSEAHFATFPPELAERCILAGCPEGGLVLDPFGGAGTTALVAVRHNRRAHLIELNPQYAQIAKTRIEKEWRVPQKPAEQGPALPLFEGAAE